MNAPWWRPKIDPTSTDSALATVSDLDEDLLPPFFD